MKKVIYLVVLGATITLASCKSEKTATSSTTPKPASNECNGKVTFASVKPILDERCTKCHSGPNPAHKIDLTTVEGVRAGVGHKLFCTITSGENCPKMPPAGPRLTAEEVAKFDCWIKNGMPE